MRALVAREIYREVAFGPMRRIWQALPSMLQNARLAKPRGDNLGYPYWQATARNARRGRRPMLETKRGVPLCEAVRGIYSPAGAASCNHQGVVRRREKAAPIASRAAWRRLILCHARNRQQIIIMPHQESILKAYSRVEGVVASANGAGEIMLPAEK